MEAVNFIEAHPRIVFWIRFILWSLLSCVLPFIFIAYRFELFRLVSKIQVGGWGIVAIVLVGVFAFTVLRYVRIALNAGYSLFGQFLNGVCICVT